MKKSLRVILVGLLTVVLSMLLTGCGGDNFQGTWIDKNSKETIRTLNIEKNGNNYLVQRASYDYNLFKPGDGQKINKDQNGVQLYNWSSTFTKYVSDKKSATPNKDTLVIAGPAQETISYIEKDGSLLYQGKTYIKVKSESDLEKAKEELQAASKAKIEKFVDELWVKSKINEIKFNDGDSFEPIIK